MKTPVLMKRDFLDGYVQQNSKTDYFSATDLILYGNEWRAKNNIPVFNQATFFQTKSTKLFIQTLEKDIGSPCKINSKGKNSHTWVHPYLFIDMALAINPKLKLKVYSWIYDSLIKYRNDSGDSYKKMTGALYLSISNKSEFRDLIIDVANRIKKECKVTDWETATEKQLELRDKIHEYISVFSDIIRDKENLVDIAIKKAKEVY